MARRSSISDRSPRRVRSFRQSRARSGCGRSAIVLVDVLTGYFGARRYLLLLDNFEHLMAGAPMVAALIRDCPYLHVLVTSREPLRVRGEREVQVNPLPVPEFKQLDLPEQLRANASVMLFIQRASDLRPDFSLNEANAQQIAEICRQLDGLPLAIELAAARIRLLSPAALMERLGKRLGLLTEGARDAPNRQQTLRGTIAWSYDLLSPVEQACFRRMSVFVNGFMFEGAVAIANTSGCDPLDIVTSLVEKSLIRTSDRKATPDSGCWDPFASLARTVGSSR